MTDQRTFDFVVDTQTEQRRARAAAIIGVAPDKIQTMRFQLDTLRQQGILVDLDISGVGMFTQAATWMELGILDDDVRRARFSRGQKSVIPEEIIKRLKSIESRMRQLLERYSYRIAGFAPYRWIPFTAYAEFSQAWSELRACFEQTKQAIIAGYTGYLDSLEADFAAVAAAAWRHIQASDPLDSRPVEVVIDGVAYPDQATFTAAIISRAVMRFPTRQKIEQELFADYSVALIYGEQDLAADKLAAERLRSQRDLERAEVNHKLNLQALAEDERRIQINAMRQAEAEHARQRLQQMASPFEEVFVTLRRQIAADAESMLESIRKNGHVRGKVAEKGAGLLEFYRLMAAHDDYELRDRLIALKLAIGPVGDQRSEATPERSPQEIAGILQQITNLVHSAAQDLTAGPSRFSLVD